MLIFVALATSASALDVWSGSNLKVNSGSGNVNGINGIQFLDVAGGALSGGLEANAAIEGDNPGLAEADWSTATTTISRTKIIPGTPDTTHDQVIVFGGHVQVGLEKTGMYGSGKAHASIDTITTPTGALDTGRATIHSNLTMNGTTSGYAIADGLAGFSSSEKSGVGSNDLFKTSGTVSGKIDLRGATNILDLDDDDNLLEHDTSLNAANNSMSAEGTIQTTAKAGVAPGSAQSDSFVIITDGDATSNPTIAFGAASATETITNANANGMGWDGSSAVVKTESSANALTKIENVNVNAVQTTWRQAVLTPGDRDQASVLNVIPTATIGGSGIWANSSMVGGFSTARAQAGTGVSANRLQIDTILVRGKVTSEAFVTGGTYNAANRVNELNEVSVSGGLGGSFPGFGSGAHVQSLLTAPLTSKANLTQIGTLNPNDRTRSVFDTRTTGPKFTGKPLEDAGSYFGTTGYSVSSRSLDTATTRSISAAGGYEINWVNGNEASVAMYEARPVVTKVGLGTSTAVLTPNNVERITLETLTETQP